LCNRALSLIKLEKAAEAKEDASEALKLDPAYFKARHRRGQALIMLGEIEDGQNDLAEAKAMEKRQKAASSGSFDMSQLSSADLTFADDESRFQTRGLASEPLSELLRRETEMADLEREQIFAAALAAKAAAGPTQSSVVQVEKKPARFFHRPDPRNEEWLDISNVKEDTSARWEDSAGDAPSSAPAAAPRADRAAAVDGISRKECDWGSVSLHGVPNERLDEGMNPITVAGELSPEIAVVQVVDPAGDPPACSACHPDPTANIFDLMVSEIRADMAQ
jgi:hypothetical protein